MNRPTKLSPCRAAYQLGFHQPPYESALVPRAREVWLKLALHLHHLHVSHPPPPPRGYPSSTATAPAAPHNISIPQTISSSACRASASALYVPLSKEAAVVPRGVATNRLSAPPRQASAGGSKPSPKSLGRSRLNASEGRERRLVPSEPHLTLRSVRNQSKPVDFSRVRKRGQSCQPLPILARVGLVIKTSSILARLLPALRECRSLTFPRRALRFCQCLSSSKLRPGQSQTRNSNQRGFAVSEEEYGGRGGCTRTSPTSALGVRGRKAEVINHIGVQYHRILR